jgi:hypothetical protein
VPILLSSNRWLPRLYQQHELPNMLPGVLSRSQQLMRYLRPRMRHVHLCSHMHFMHFKVLPAQPKMPPLSQLSSRLSHLLLSIHLQIVHERLLSCLPKVYPLPFDFRWLLVLQQQCNLCQVSECLLLGCIDKQVRLLLKADCRVHVLFEWFDLLAVLKHVFFGFWRGWMHIVPKRLTGLFIVQKLCCVLNMFQRFFSALRQHMPHMPVLQRWLLAMHFQLHNVVMRKMFLRVLFITITKTMPTLPDSGLPDLS